MTLKSIDRTAWIRYLTIVIFKIMSWKQVRQKGTSSGSVQFISPKFCIKTTASLSEAKTLEFIRRHTSVPVPKVYCAFVHKGRSYILMERIDGHKISDGWAIRSERSKTQILKQLRKMIEELRNVHAIENQGVTGVDGGPIYDPRLPKSSFWGPFKTIHEFHHDLRNGIDENNVHDDTLPGLRELVSFHNQAWGRPVLTHGDLSSLNVLVQGEQVVGIIDWETAGWLPPYWEYVSAWNVNPQNRFWQDEVDKFLTAYPYALKMDAVRRKYFGDF